jgi:hypothetical protein
MLIVDELRSVMAKRPKTPPSEPVAQGVGTPPGFGKDVNDYLNHYVTVADAKAGAVLAADVAIAVLIFDRNAFAGDRYFLLRASLGFLVLSAGICASVIFPRLPSGKTGLVFWEDIRNRKTLVEYARDVAVANAAAIEREYASQNWFVSHVLHKKYRLLQAAIVAFGVGVALAAVFGITR